MNFKVEIPPVEHKNHALTRHVILKRPQASWSQSVFSVPFGDSPEKIVPNRDYPYEGLSVLIEGANFHFLDGIAVGVKKGAQYAKLRAKKVTVSPWNAIYYYENKEEGVNLAISYYLMNIGAKPNGVTACVSFESNATSVVIEPIVDIRHMYDYSEPEEHFSNALNDGLRIWKDEKCISIRTVNECEVRTWKKKTEWWYKLGSGFREKTDGGVAFKGEIKKPVSLGEIEISFDDSSTALLTISCSNSEAQLEWLNEKGKNWLRDESEEEKRAQEIVKSLGITNPAVAFRALALSKFGMHVGGDFFYEAGDFWFRTPWFRDMFEGIINNVETLFRIGHADRIRSAILHSFEYQDEYGRIPNRFPERTSEELDYNNADATLLAFIAAGEFLKRKRDEGFANTILERAEFAISRFEMNDLNRINGAPVLSENGLVSVVPGHSWTDTKREIEIEGKRAKVSVRIPDSWCYVRGEDELNKPKYFLPELNAEWIKMLSHCVRMCSENEDKKGIFFAILEKALRNFKAVFWDAEENNLYNIVTTDGKKDKTQGSPAVVAFSLLLGENVFSQSELKEFIKGVKANLLVEKNGLPFGIVVKKSPKRTYYGDEEYHEAVVWPRDTPYLIRILQAAGEIEIVEGILRSNSEHQMSEGFVFYNSELFSPDKGKMTPVKNPVQFWSQWVDPFL
ncbi:MAG: amylo-alpha-1,6-glucosidase [Halobacteriota archaeon]